MEIARSELLDLPLLLTGLDALLPSDRRFFAEVGGVNAEVPLKRRHLEVRVHAFIVHDVLFGVVPVTRLWRRRLYRELKKLIFSALKKCTIALSGP